MPSDRMVQIAMKLQLLGVSGAGITELLCYDLDLVERQLEFLPFRKAKRPEAFIIEAVRNNYNPPKEFYYAKTETQPAPSTQRLDQDSQPRIRQAPADPQGYGTQSTPGLDPSDLGLEQGGTSRSLALPDFDQENRSSI